MGWSFTYGKTKKDLVEYLTKNNEWVNDKGVKIANNHVASSLVGNHLWASFDRYKDDVFQDRYIVLFLLANDKSMSERSRSNDNWGYKDISESMGPAYYDCPLYLLDMTPVPSSEYAAGWREKVRAHHAKKRGWSSLKAGDTVKLADWMVKRYGQETVTIENATSRGRLYKAGVIGGIRYKLDSKCLDLS